MTAFCYHCRNEIKRIYYKRYGYNFSYGLCPKCERKVDPTHKESIRVVIT